VLVDVGATPVAPPGGATVLRASGQLDPERRLRPDMTVWLDVG
jgi:hypothetical protein